MLGSSGPRLASRRPWWYLQVDHSSSGRARPTHIGGLVVWVNHHKNRPIPPRLCWFECIKANELTSCALHTTVWRHARAMATRTMTIPPFKLAATTSAPKFLSSHHKQALCSSLTETHPLHHYCKQTLRHGKLQDALAGSMMGSSGPRLASRRP